MDLRTEIFREHSRANALRITAWIGSSKERFGQLMQLFLHDEYRVVQRAAHIISYVSEAQPALLAPHLPAMVQRMQDKGIPVAVKRNVVRVLQYLPIPEALHGEVMDQCFALLADPKENVAVRAFSMTVLGRLALEYPEISNEIKLVIEDELLNGNPSPGFRSRAKKVLKALSDRQSPAKRTTLNKKRPS